jgi:hypothetical protein
MFDRLMAMVGKIRGLGCEELDDHKIIKIMLETYTPRNETVVTLIRDKKKFEYFTPNDVLHSKVLGVFSKFAFSKHICRLSK